MPAVSFDSKSFLLQTGRGVAARMPIVAAAFDAALIDPSEWSDTLARLRHAGFNTVVVRVPWLMHEPTPDRFVFTGSCDVRRAVQAAAAAGLKVLLRIGPCVGGSFAAGGLPGWLRDVAGGRVREANAEFLSRVTRFWRALSAQFVDLQATRNGNGVVRPIIAVGIEDDWRCLDAEVGEAYFSALVRFAREVGVDVPLFTANNCWYSHEGVIDAWRNAADAARTASELRQVLPDTPPMLMHEASAGRAALDRAVAESVAARADFVCEVVGTRHRGATSAQGLAEVPARDLHPLRRALVFATSFGEILAGMVPDAPVVDTEGRMCIALRGSGREQIDAVFAAQPANRRKPSKSNAPDAPCEVGFHARNLAIAGAMLGQCSGSLVALLGDLLIVAGTPRGKITLQVDGSTVALAVPAEGSAPKVAKVRGLRVAVVPHGLAAGVGIGADAIEFVDRDGALVVRIARDGTVTRAKPAQSRSSTPRPLALSVVRCVAEPALLDGTHARFAAIAAPKSLGAFGLQAMHGYYCARFEAPRKSGRDSWIEGSGIGRIARTALKSRGIACAVEVRAAAGPSSGSHRDERMGVTGPVREVAALKSGSAGVRAAIVDLPRFDATRIGRFAWGYEARADAERRTSVRWVFAARSTSVIVQMPAWWFDEGHAWAGHALRLNGELVAGADWCGRAWAMLDGSLLSPMRPKRLAKGEKPPKAKAVKLEPGANELLLDVDPLHPLDERTLKRLMKDTQLLEVCGEIAASWSFARVEPPASWAGAAAVPRKAIDAPAWFRTTVALDAPRALELVCMHAAGRVATVLVNGEPVMVLDGASGERSGTARKPQLKRTASIPAALLRSGENEICIFEPDGVMPAIEVRVAPSSA